MTLQTCVHGAVVQMETRARWMLANIPGDLPRDYDALAALLEERIVQSLRQLEALRTNRENSAEAKTGVRFRTFKREVAELEHLERFGLAPLSRAHPNDNALNRLVHAIKRETHFPFVAPVVSPFSHQYYLTDTRLRVIAVPLLEGSFILHLADLYHELAHFFLTASANPKTTPLIDAYVVAGAAVSEHYARAVRIAGQGFSPQSHAGLLTVFRSSWIKYWLKEFFCDVFAAAALGPAYGWAHLFLTLKHVPNPFETPVSKASTHPPDHARMEVIAAVLQETGHAAAEHTMRQIWSKLLEADGQRREAEFDLAVPAGLRQSVVTQALAGYRQIGCQFATPGSFPPVAQILNQAWEIFLADPDGFPDQESELRTRLFALVAS